MGKYVAEVIFVHLPSTRHRSYMDGIGQLVARARREGHKLALLIDYHVQDPYHGVPPHIDVKNDTQFLTKDKKRRDAGLGYAPFAWVDGWNWARGQIRMLMETFNPDFIQQGESNALRNGWAITAGKPHWFYNDTMTIFKQAADDTGWNGTYVVEGWKTSLVKAREYFGRDNVIWHGDLEDVIIDDTPPPPPVDDCNGELADAKDEIVALEQYVEELSEDLAIAETANMEYAAQLNSCHAALVECQESPCVCDCEDCDEKYQGLQDSLDDLLDILWAFIGGRGTA